MCLAKLELIPRTSFLPMKVYKVLLSNDRSPFRYQKYHHGINEPEPQPIQLPEVIISKTIEGGYLHAYVTLEAAARSMQEYVKRYSDSYDVKITEMYIPPETEYWIGAADEIAAKKLDWPGNAEEWCSDSLDYPAD
jgi:hypothetical protein